MKTTTKLLIKIILLVIVAFALGYAVHGLMQGSMCLVPQAKLSAWGYYFR